MITDIQVPLTQHEINRIKVARVKCQLSLLFHTRYFFKAQYKKKFVIGDPHRIICEALERVLTGKCKRLIINIAPRYGKTELAVKSLISHGLALNPAAKFIHLSYSDDLALDNSEHVKDLVNSAEYQQLFPGVVVKSDSKAKNKWYTTAGGGVLARSAGGSVTGFGAGQVDTEEDFDEFLAGINSKENLSKLELKQLFGGCIIIDDALKPEDADSDVKREAVNQRFDSTVRNRGNSRDTPIVIIGQRLHPNDLPGYLQRPEDADQWEVISLPSINQKPIPVPGEWNIDGTERTLIVGEALLPWKHTLEELDKLKIANDLVFERQHMQDPNPKSGLLFPLQLLHFFDYTEMYETLSDPDYCYVCADPANLGGDDFAAGAFKLIGDKIYVPSVIYNTDGTDHNEPEVVQLVIDHKPAAVGVESVIGWKETAKKIQLDLTTKNYSGEFRQLHPRTNKHVRINNRASFIRNHFVFRNDWKKYPQYSKFMRCLTSYLKIQEPGRKNKRDDAPDLCEMAAQYFERNFPHLWPVK